MTGFRVGAGGACGLYGLRPDLVTFGKVIGAGLPVGAFGGRADVMDRVAPAGPIYQAGTLSGNPMAMAAGFATLRLMTPSAYERLEATSAKLADGLARAAEEAKVPVQVNRVGSMLTVFFSARPVFDAASARACDTKRFGAFFHALLENGVYFPPSQFEAAFLSTAHTDDDVEQTLRAARAGVRRGGEGLARGRGRRRDRLRGPVRGARGGRLPRRRLPGPAPARRGAGGARGARAEGAAVADHPADVPRRSSPRCARSRRACSARATSRSRSSPARGRS